ncbi:MAG: type III-A CRISPR-associated RAMP protein Csm3 [Armatimonadota bacterium]|nr:type III-A CRISPR-associated RAMP protein Csm3 [Armatimonadota bacterium]
MKLERIVPVTGRIELLTGMHIGAGTETTQIGGVDNPIIRLPKDGNPYIPGSSLKGRMRALLELYLGKVEGGGDPHVYKGDSCKNEYCPICYLFGAAADTQAPIGPGRLIVRDCVIDESLESNERIKLESTGLPYTEEKTEISINRITSKVEKGLRKTERVPAGVIFDLDISLRKFEGDPDSLLKWMLTGLALIQKDGIGGSISRGYGKIRITELKVDGKEAALPEV